MWGRRKPNEVQANGGVDHTIHPDRKIPQVKPTAQGNHSVLSSTSAAGHTTGSTSHTDEVSAPSHPEDDASRSSAARDSGPLRPSPDEVRFAVTFTRIISILMRSPHYRQYTIADLEWLVAPAILTGQSAVMEARVNGKQMPVAVAMWASVSEDVDQRLSSNLSTPLKLQPDEWRSGDILWLVDAVGDRTAVARLLKDVQASVFKQRQAKMRMIGPDSRPRIQLLEPQAAEQVSRRATS